MRHVLCIVPLLFACSGPTTGEPDASPDAAPSDGALPSDAGSESSDGAAPGDPLPAAIELYEVVLTTDAGTGGISLPSAKFQRKNGQNPLPCSITQTMGPCTVQVCSPNKPSDPIDVRAGTVTFSGSGMPIPLMPDPKGFYPSPMVPWIAFVPGDTLMISVAGDPSGVPAFQTSLPAPQSLVVSMPSGTNVARPVPRANDFVVTWTPTNSPDEVVAGVGAFDAQMNTVEVECTVARSAGTVTVPKELLMLLAPTPPMGQRGVYGAFSRRKTSTTAGPFPVEVRAGIFATASTGEPIYGDAIIQ